MTTTEYDINDRYMLLNDTQIVIDCLGIILQDLENNPTGVLNFGSYGIDSIDIIQKSIDKLKELQNREHQDEIDYEINDN